MSFKTESKITVTIKAEDWASADAAVEDAVVAMKGRLGEIFGHDNVTTSIWSGPVEEH